MVLLIQNSPHPEIWNKGHPQFPLPEIYTPALSELSVKTPPGAANAASASRLEVAASTKDKRIAKRKRKELPNFIHLSRSPSYIKS